MQYGTINIKMTKRLLIVGNWKMNLSIHQSSTLVHRLTEKIQIHKNTETVLAPNFICLQPLSLQIDPRKFKLAAQNGHHKDEGPFTGEVSFSMLRGLVDYAIVGHSDRRYKFHESLDDIRDKMTACIRNDIVPILCVGETRQERSDKETNRVIHDQVTTALSDLTAEDLEKVVIAYEPVWALSNGSDYMHHELPTPGIITDAVRSIRMNVEQMFTEEAASDIRVLYGGSVSSSTAGGILDIEGVDGLLVGGASINYAEFAGIADAAFRTSQKDL